MLAAIFERSKPNSVSTLVRTDGVLLSCEVPTKFLSRYDECLDYYFALAHLVLQDSAYREFYASSAKYTILDNSAFELGVPISNNKLLEAAKIINPNEIVCRDSLGNGSMTIERTEETLEYFAKRKFTAAFMGVLQGTNFKDFVKCLEWMTKCDDITTLGLNGWPASINAFKDIIGTDDATQCRLAALDFMKKEGFTTKPVHLLGMGNNPIELKKASKYKFVRSCDTSSPILHGIYAIKFDKDQGLFGPKIREKLNFNLDRLNEVQAAAISHNLKMFRAWSK